MAKQSYKVPTSLGLSWMDQEISVFDSTQARQFQLGLLLSWLLSAFLGFWLVSQTFLGRAGVLVTTLFVLWWVLATAFYCRLDATRRMRLLALRDLPGYVPPSRRKVLVRSSSPAADLVGLTGIRAVEESRRPGEPALVRFVDGGLGHAYQVVGSASALLFESDRTAIMDRVDAFWRKADTASEWVFVTLKRSQRVDPQLRRCDELRRANAGSPQLLALVEERAAVLSEEVGRDYLSIQQYLLVRSPGQAPLDHAYALVVSEARESALMLRAAEPLDRARTLELLSELFRA